mmetsp:Transcript_13837/g.18899  ORF Transcript_13837/g.18899 Transcript_13837/m.18899 type:complete len:233 (+) Transcript_13837:71-769(+)
MMMMMMIVDQAGRVKRRRKNQSIKSRKLSQLVKMTKLTPSQIRLMIATQVLTRKQRTMWMLTSIWMSLKTTSLKTTSLEKSPRRLLSMIKLGAKMSKPRLLVKKASKMMNLQIVILCLMSQHRRSPLQMNNQSLMLKMSRWKTRKRRRMRPKKTQKMPMTPMTLTRLIRRLLMSKRRLRSRLLLLMTIPRKMRKRLILILMTVSKTQKMKSGTMMVSLRMTYSTSGSSHSKK